MRLGNHTKICDFNTSFREYAGCPSSPLGTAAAGDDETRILAKLVPHLYPVTPWRLVRFCQTPEKFLKSHPLVSTHLIQIFAPIGRAKH